MVWDPKSITPRHWGDVVQFFRGLEDRNADYAPLSALATHVAAQSYAAALWAATSGTSLLIARRSNIDWTREALRVDLTLASAVRFIPPAKGRSRPNAFECDGVRAVASLQRFLRERAWIKS
jgi:hypothetical protein